MESPRFTILRRDTEWDFPEINILAKGIKDLIFHYDKAPGIVVILGEYTREDIVDILGYGNFEIMLVEGFGCIPSSLILDARETFNKKVTLAA